MRPKGQEAKFCIREFYPSIKYSPNCLWFYMSSESIAFQMKSDSESTENDENSCFRVKLSILLFNSEY